MKRVGLLGSMVCVLALVAAAAPSEAASRRVSRLSSGNSVWHEDYHRQYADARPGHLTDLVGDDFSGLGFYPLPRGYRAGAERYGRYRSATNAVRYAVASQALESPFFFPTGNTDYRYGVFNPNDGVGTPFFAGYYAN